MQLSIFSVLDETLGAYLPPIYERNRGSFVRAFTEACKNPESSFSKYPDQFTAYEIGTWDDNSCLFNIYTVSDRIGKASDFIQPQD